MPTVFLVPLTRIPYFARTRDNSFVESTLNDFDFIDIKKMELKPKEIITDKDCKKQRKYRKNIIKLQPLWNKY